MRAEFFEELRQHIASFHRQLKLFYRATQLITASR